MFPQNQYKDTVTLFTPHTDPATGNTRYYRHVLRRCFWNADSVAVLRAGGTAVPEQIDLNIPLPLNPGYVHRTEWANVDKAGAWTLRLGTPGEWTIILKGEVNYPALEVWRGQEDMDRTLSAFRREVTTGEHRPTDVSEIMFGPRSLWRVTASC